MTTRVTDITLEILVSGDIPVTPDVATTTPHDCALLKTYYAPRVAVLSDGLPGILLRAQPSPYIAEPNRIYFARFAGEGTVRTPVAEVFAYDTPVFGLALYKGLLVAVAQDPSTSLLRARVSSNDGLTWGADTLLGEGNGARSYRSGPGTQGWSFSLVTDRAGNNLYLFYLVTAGLAVKYRTTSNVNPLAGWGAESASGFSVTSIGRNFGGSTARNQQDTVGFSGPIETKDAGKWVIGAESDDGDFHANHAIFKGTLGGAWTRKFNGTYGGGLSGNQGSNGAMFYTENQDLVCTMMDDNGGDLFAYYSYDHGETWGTFGQQMPQPLPFGIIGMGQHTGAWIESWGQTYIWGGLAGLEPYSTEATDLYATRISYDPSFAPLMFNDILGEQGVYGCVGDSEVNLFMPTIQTGKLLPTIQTGKGPDAIKSGQRTRTIQTRGG